MEYNCNIDTIDFAVGQISMSESIEEKRCKAIDELKRIASLLGQNSVSQRQFDEHSQLSARNLHTWFGNWTSALESAGLEMTRNPNSGPQVSEFELLTALNVWKAEHGAYPTMNKWNAEGGYSVTPYVNRWGSWTNAIEAAKSQSLSSCSYLHSVSPSVQQSKTTPIEVTAVSSPPIPVNQRGSVVQYGAPMNFRGLRHEPINEQGVVYLFGMVSSELGFLIEAIRTAFPDCEGKRKVDAVRNRWESVKIEFEFTSRNFQRHGHSIEECNVIVCWEHDWLECPLEVIELKSVIHQLPNHN